MKGDVRLTLSHRRSAFARPGCETLREHPVSPAMWESRCSFSCGAVSVFVRRRSMMWVRHRWTSVRLLAIFASCSRQSRRKHPGQPKVLSTIQRCGRTPNPVWSSLR